MCVKLSGELWRDGVCVLCHHSRVCDDSVTSCGGSSVARGQPGLWGKGGDSLKKFKESTLGLYDLSRNLNTHLRLSSALLHSSFWLEGTSILRWLVLLQGPRAPLPLSPKVD